MSPSSSQRLSRYAGRQTRPSALPASTQLQGRRRTASQHFLAAPALQRPATLPHRVRVPPRVLVQRRDLRNSARAQRRALHRRKRRPANARGPHRSGLHLLPPAPQRRLYRRRDSTPSPNASPRSPQQRDVFVYFKHEDEPTGALNADSLSRTRIVLEAGTH